MAHTAKQYGPHPVDLAVGARLRLRRIAAGMSQERLARALGITFQQVQKYESGDNRISASRLWEIAEALETPVADFFADAARGAPAYPTRIGAAAEREIIDLVAAFGRIGDDEVRSAIRNMSRCMAEALDRANA